jgi:hypothetical protein
MTSYVFLLLIVWGNATGEPVMVFEPIPVFTSMEKCLEISQTAPPPPDGHSVSMQCIQMSAPVVKDTTKVER